jgi:capsule polysaccharide export protein KpsE/RkpR
VVRQYDQSYLSLVGNLGSRLSVSIDKKTAILLISATMPDRYAAADLVRVSADRLMQRIIEYESQKAGQNFRFVNEQYLQAKDRYERAQRDLASFTDRNRVLMSATSQIDRDRFQREYDIAFEVYQQISRELEQARIKMNQDTPVFTVLDQVTVPNIKSRPNRPQIVLFALFLGFLTGVISLGLRHLLAQAKTS